MNYTYHISSTLINGTKYGSNGFVSPMKELNEQTVLIESRKNKNDSYRQKNTLFPNIQEALEKVGIDIQGKEYAIEMDIYGRITVTGDFSEKEKRLAADVLEGQFSDELWDCHMQASDYTASEFNRIYAYKELLGFLGKTTGGQYSWEDISVDGNGKISGLPEKMCQLLNSQESNGRYEQLRDDILMLCDYGKIYGMDALSRYKVRYEVAGTDIKIMNN